MRRTLWRGMIPLLLLMTALSSAHLLSDAIWFDEWITYFISGGGNPPVAGTLPGDNPCSALPGGHTPLQTVCLAAIDNSWPPAYFLLLQGWSVFSGGNLLLDRLLALFIGLLTVSVVYRIGRRLFNPATGLIAAMLMGSSAFLLFYMHEVRGYTLYALLCALSTWQYLRLRDDPSRLESRFMRWSFPVLIALTLYSHYIAAASVLALALNHLLFERPAADAPDSVRDTWQRVLKLWLNGCLMFAPWLAVTVISVINESLTQRSLDTVTLLRGMIYGFSNNLWWLALPALVLTLTRWRERNLRFVWLWGIVILLVAIAGNLLADFLFHPRHIMGLMPALMLLIAAGLWQTRRMQRQLPWLLTGLWLGAGFVHALTPAFMDALPRHISTMPTPALNALQQTVNACVLPDDLLVFSVDAPVDEWIHDLPVEYYFGGAVRDQRHLTHLGMLVTDGNQNSTRLLPMDLFDESYTERVRIMTADSDRVWIAGLSGVMQQANLMHLDRLLRQREYTPCATLLDDSGAFVFGYTQDSCDTLCSGS